MKKYFVSAVVLGLFALGGCATDPNYAKAKAADIEKNGQADALTGSRLVKPTTERVVKAVGNKEYTEAGNVHTSIGNAVGLKSN
jgi:hypothetical protein